MDHEQKGRAGQASRRRVCLRELAFRACISRIVFNRRRIPMLQKSPMYAYIPVKDLARARKFYEEKLGFRPKREDAGGVVYESGEGTACFMYVSPGAGTSKASQAFWQVDDIEREVAELKRNGVKFEEYDAP